MIRIRTFTDIEEVKKKELLTPDYIAELEIYYKSLVINLTGKNLFNTYSLEHDGDIIVLTSDDDIDDLPISGFGKEFGGLYSATIEFCIKKRLGPQWVYQILIICNNDYVLVLYSEAGQFGDDFDRWLEGFI